MLLRTQNGLFIKPVEKDRRPHLHFFPSLHTFESERSCRMKRHWPSPSSFTGIMIITITFSLHLPFHPSHFHPLRDLICVSLPFSSPSAVFHPAFRRTVKWGHRKCHGYLLFLVFILVLGDFRLDIIIENLWIFFDYIFYIATYWFIVRAIFLIEK